ncbi:hypothetical protein ALC56_08482, partial [Trachymyrmex septentrionalis]
KNRCQIFQITFEKVDNIVHRDFTTLLVSYYVCFSNDKAEARIDVVGYFTGVYETPKQSCWDITDLIKNKKKEKKNRGKRPGCVHDRDSEFPLGVVANSLTTSLSQGESSSIDKLDRHP